jgi:hypothetical protein
MNYISKKQITLITIIAVLLASTMIVAVYWFVLRKPPVQTNFKQADSITEPTSESQTITESQTNATPQPASTASIVPLPKQPTFTKSSGNNGPVPVGVNINFVCTAEPGVDCSIVLDSGSKNAVVGPAKVTDNGRGQYFASLYWTSVKGSYKVTAQAKNIQGGVSSSIVQTLEVQ